MPSEPFINLSPKARFLANKTAASAHSDLMASPPFIAAAAAALLHYQYQSLAVDPSIGAIMAARLRGAQDFLHCLMNLGRLEDKMPVPEDQGLVPPEEALAKALRG